VVALFASRGSPDALHYERYERRLAARRGKYSGHDIMLPKYVLPDARRNVSCERHLGAPPVRYSGHDIILPKFFLSDAIRKEQFEPHSAVVREKY